MFSGGDQPGELPAHGRDARTPLVLGVVMTVLNLVLNERAVGLFYCLGLSTRLARGGTGRDEGSAISTKHLCQGIWKRTGFARLQVNGDNDHFGISHQLFICIDDHLF